MYVQCIYSCKLLFMCAYPFACLCDAQKIHITCVNVLCQVMLQYLKCPYIGTIHKVGGASMTVCPTHPHLAKGEFYMFLLIMQLCLSSFVYFIFLLLLLLLCFSFPWLIKFNQSINQTCHPWITWMTLVYVHTV